MHPITDREDFVKAVKSRDISETYHYVNRVESRSLVENQEVKESVMDLSDLLAFEYKKDSSDNERYNLLFDKSNKYYLLVAVSFVNSHINLVTAFVTRKSKGSPEELVGKWG